MNVNFALILVILTVVSGGIALLDIFIFVPRRKHKQQQLQEQGQQQAAEQALKQPRLIEYARSFFPIFLIVLLLRSFLAEPFRIPSGSLEPTLLVGDFVLVNKYKYGLRLPVLNYKFVEIDEPESGDVVVFRWPPEPNIDYIKRIVGVPGDHIEYIDKQLIINGQSLEQEFIDNTSNIDSQGRTWRVEKRLEKLNDEEYYIYVRPDVRAQNFEVTVPPGHYFVIVDKPLLR